MLILGHKTLSVLCWLFHLLVKNEYPALLLSEGFPSTLEVFHYLSFRLNDEGILSSLGVLFAVTPVSFYINGFHFYSFAWDGEGSEIGWLFSCFSPTSSL